MSAAKVHDVAETTAIADRVMRDGTPLRYQLKVLQQPQRARACGQGAKSHADRRPVDPPPVVELKIFSGEDMKSDVTFSHNSNFFLYATLEQARPIAQGRGMPAPAPAPVLTGVPVSGMAYLDRPSPAGYFIFPDLSVRHEGKYRLRFSLYEETKDVNEMQGPVREGEPREFATHRVEVKSKPFTVFSAKKFPGLAESTALSRIVAEQGCRVRIRRDVRMRRRNDRPSRDCEGEMDETAQLRAGRRAATPDGYQSQPNQPAPLGIPQGHHMQHNASTDRKRSDSDVSGAAMPDMQSQAFGDRYGSRPEHHTYGAPPNHLSFGGANPPHHPAPPQNVHPPQVYNQHAMPPRYPTNTLHHQHQAPHAAPTPRPQPVQNGQYGAGAQYHRDKTPSGQQNIPMRRPSNAPEYQSNTRRESDGVYRAPQNYGSSTPNSHYHQQMDNMGYAPPQYEPSQQQYHSSGPAPQAIPPSLPPLKLPPLALEPKLYGKSPSSAGPPTAPPPQYQPAPPPTSQQYQYAPQPPPHYIPVAIPESAPRAPPAPRSEVPRGTKREWGRVFNDAHVSEPLHNGRRPDVISENSGYGADADVDEDDDFDLGKLKMTYRRADGEEIVRRLPLEE